MVIEIVNQKNNLVIFCYFCVRFEENTLLSEALAKFIDEEASDAVIRQKLHDYTHSDAQKIHILMKVENRPADSVR